MIKSIWNLLLISTQPLKMNEPGYLPNKHYMFLW